MGVRNFPPMGVACRILPPNPASFRHTRSSWFQSIVRLVFHVIPFTPIHHSGRFALSLRIHDIGTIPSKVLRELETEPKRRSSKRTGENGSRGGSQPRPVLRSNSNLLSFKPQKDQTQGTRWIGALRERLPMRIWIFRVGGSLTIVPQRVGVLPTAGVTTRLGMTTLDTITVARSGNNRTSGSRSR